MALTGKFIADFSDFYAAAQKAEISIKSIGDSASTVGPKLNSLAEQFSGKRIIQEATLVTRVVEEIGGVSKLTAQELARVGATMEQALEKMRKAGEPIPKNMQDLADATAGAGKSTGIFNTAVGVATGGLAAFGIQLSLDYVIGFVGDIHDAADALVKLHDKTGISIEALQQFQVAGDDAGVSIEDMGRAINAMQNKIASGDKAALAALAAMNISVEDFIRLDPAAQYMALSRGIQTIEDPARQVALATDLMGKAGVETLPVLKRGFDDVAQGAVGMSTTSVKAIDAFGDSVGSKTKWLKTQFAEAYADIITGTTLAARKMADEWNKQIENVAKNAPKLRMAAQLAVPGLPADLDAIWAAQDKQRDQIDKTVEANKKAKKAQEDYNETLRKLRDQLTGGDLLDKASLWVKILEDGIPVAQLTAQQQAAVNKVMADALDVYQALGAEAPKAMTDIYVATLKAVPAVYDFATALSKMPQNIKPVELLATQTVPNVGGLVGDMTSWLTPKVSTSGAKLGAALSSSILSAIQGGGNVLQAAGSALGLSLFDPKEGAFGKSITKMATDLPGALGGAIGAALPIVGSLIGPAISLIAKPLGKLFGRDEESKQVNPLRDQFVAAAGGLAQLNAQAAAAGVTLDAMLKADTVTEYQAAIAELTTAFGSQTEALAVAMETAQRYGFTLEELGPALQRQELDKQAQQLFKDWEVLNAAGIDTVAITERMAESVNTYLQRAIAMGTEVPEAMRPMLEAMAKQGELTDASGNKIENLEDSGVTFALSMSDGFKKLIEGVEKLTDAITRGLGGAVDATSRKITTMPKTVDVQVKYHDPGFTPSGSPVPLEGYQEGTQGFRDFGAGTPVLLHGWEAVVPRDQGSVPGAGLTLTEAAGGAGGAAVVNIVINAEGAFFETPGSLQQLADKVERALSARHSLNHKRRAA
jgi:hypothetical protein